MLRWPQIRSPGWGFLSPPPRASGGWFAPRASGEWFALQNRPKVTPLADPSRPWGPRMLDANSALTLRGSYSLNPKLRYVACFFGPLSVAREMLQRCMPSGTRKQTSATFSEQRCWYCNTLHYTTSRCISIRRAGGNML